MFLGTTNTTNHDLVKLSKEAGRHVGLAIYPKKKKCGSTLFNKQVLTACARYVLTINIKWWITLNLEFTYYTNKIYKLFDF